MQSFLFSPKPIFSPSRAFLKHYHSLQFPSFTNMDRSGERGRFPNQRNLSSSSDAGTPHHPNKLYAPPHRRPASNWIVKNTSSGEKPVVGGIGEQGGSPRAVFQQMVKSSYRERPFVADSSSDSAMRDKCDFASVDIRNQAIGVVQSPERGENVVRRHKSPEHSREVISQSRSSPPKEYTAQAVIRPSKFDQNEIKEHGFPEHSKKEISQQRKSSPKREYSHNGPDHADVMPYTPFDLFILNAKTSVLKQSLYEMNREKRNDPRPDILRPGMVLLKNFITPDDQIKILKKCRDTGLGPGGFYQPGYADGAKLRLHMMCFGKDWDPQSCSYEELRSIDGVKPPIIPDDFRKLVGDAIQASHAKIRANGVKYPDKAIPLMEPDICIVNFYDKTGKLGLHQDKDESRESIKSGLPVVSFSIGDSAEFLYGDDRDVNKAEKIELKSGDVLIFGGKSRFIFHGVPSIKPNTAPKFLVNKVNLRPGRLNLTFRKY